MSSQDESIPELDAYEDEYSALLARVEWMAKALDSRFVIPGTKIRFGWDGIIGLIPGIGDTLMVAPQLYLLYEAYRAKLGVATIVRMLGNVFIDWLVGLVPLLGDFFDFAFKSNLRNARLIAKQIRKKRVRRD